MNPDRLIDAVAREVRAQDEAEGSGADAEYEDALFRPLGDQERDRIEARVLALTAGEPSAAAKGPAQVVSIAKRRRAAVAAVLAPLALAAGLLLFLRTSPETSGLPGYQFDVRGGASELRSPGAADSSTPIVLAPGSQLEVIARPNTAIQGKVGARAYFVQGETVRPWVPTIDISQDGAIRATAGPSGWQNLAPGRWDLVLIIARPEDLPPDASQARRQLAAGDDNRVQVLRRAVDVKR